MPEKSKTGIVMDAMSFYESQGYGKLPTPATPSALKEDKNFCDFFSKYETAYSYYSETGFPEFLIQSQMGGIDFTEDVEITVIPKGQKHTQTQSAWGAKGNYYSDSTHSSGALGISDQGRVFDPSFVPPHLQEVHDAAIKEQQAKILETLGLPQANFEDVFPTLPSSDSPVKPQVMITDKSIRTYEAASDVRCLKSSARAVQDTWSVPGKSIDCPGGGMQLFVSPSENAKMELNDYGVHDEPKLNNYTKP